jgi:cyclophilin family peptidyl-prolyl cis-trans isomerase/GTPase SAR1 family protein
LTKQKRLLGGKALEHDASQPLVVHSTLGYLGGLEELIVWACATNEEYADPRLHPEYASVEDELQTLADREFAAHIETASASGQTAFAYIDFGGSRALDAAAIGKHVNAGGAPSRPGTSAGTGASSAQQSRPATQGGSSTGRRRGSHPGDAAGDNGPHRVIIELFKSRCPRTVDNFLRLCTGSEGSAVDARTGKKFPLHYQGAPVHRIVKDGWIQTGDIVSGRGCDSHSALTGEGGEALATFPDEHLATKLDSAGLLAMCNSGPHTNGSQFLVTLRALPAFDHKYVVFGRVIFGMATLAAMGSGHVPCKHNQRPLEPLTIVQSDVFSASMLDDHVNKWTRKRAPPKKKKKPSAAASSARGGVPESPRLAPKSATLLVVGFTGAGKSTIVKNLLGRPFEHCNPTGGFERSQLLLPPSPYPEQHHAPFQLNLWGLGGAPNLRGYWPNYFDAVHGVLFVVDASVTDETVWDDLHTSFAELTAHPLVTGKPILIFANKQDQPGALSATEVNMRLQRGMNAAGAAAAAGSAAASDEQKRPSTSGGLTPSAGAAGSSALHVVKCTARTDLAKKADPKASPPAPLPSPLSPAGAALHPDPSEDPSLAALTGGPADVDPSIPRGLGWLLGRIEAQYQSLSERVASDVAEVRRKAKEQMDASKAKIRAAREAREAEEAAQEAKRQQQQQQGAQ